MLVMVMEMVMVMLVMVLELVLEVAKRRDVALRKNTRRPIETDLIRFIIINLTNPTSPSIILHHHISILNCIQNDWNNL